MYQTIQGLSAYSQMNRFARTGSTSGKSPSGKSEKNDKARGRGNYDADGAGSPRNVKGWPAEEQIETREWSPLSSKSSLIPTDTEDYGNAIGDVKLSDEAKEYYRELKSKFGNADFILVSSDMKSAVQQNAASYGNANKMVVLIDEAKIERMASDPSFRKKYEGIISMSQTKLEGAKNSLISSGLPVKSFGMSVDSDGKESFFAVTSRSSDIQSRRLEKKAEEKKERKLKEKKQADKKRQEERLEKAREKRRQEKAGRKPDMKAEEETDREGRVDEDGRDGYGYDSAAETEYEIIEAATLDQLLDKVQRYSYSRAGRSVMTEAEKAVGAHFDFRG